MFNLYSPIFFWLAPILLVFVVYLNILNNKRKKSLMNFPQYSLFSSINKSKKLKFYPIVTIINYLILILFIVALVRPQIGNKTDDVLNQGIDIFMAIDVSSSMEALDFDPLDRINAAKKVATDFIKTRTYDRVGVVLFSGLAFTQVPLTNDIDTVIKSLNNISTRMISVNGTAIGSAIVTACNRLRNSQTKEKIIVLITDGANNIGEVDPITAAEIAKSLKVRVYTIGAGSSDGAYHRVMDVNNKITKVKVVEDELDEETLTKIADITGGQYFRANNTKMLEQIMKQIDKLEKTEINNIKFSSYKDIYDKIILIILALILLNIFLENIIFRKLIV